MPATADLRADCELSPEQLIARLARQIIDLYAQRHGEPACGRHRAVFFDGDVVWKVPRNWQGMDANQREARWRSAEIPLARCELHYEMPSGIAVLKMERVEPVGGADLPDWTLAVDCQQVGRTRDGRLVAYDL